MDHFELVSEYAPTGDQPQAIEQLVKGFQKGNQCQTLLGVTGSGKTFTMANVIKELNRPTLIIAHNKTLAAQLYSEFKEFFPNNAVEYFVSYYTKDIDYENHEIRVDFRDDNENDARAKNAEERRGRVSDDTFEFLLYYIGEYWDILQKQEYLFINIKGDTIGKPLRVDSVYDMFERMEKKTGIKITPHMLRRYYANTRWEADWPLEMISQALGHKHLDTTIRYLNVLDDKLKTASQEFYRRYSKLYGVEQFLESRR